MFETDEVHMKKRTTNYTEEIMTVPWPGLTPKNTKIEARVMEEELMPETFSSFYDSVDYDRVFPPIPLGNYAGLKVCALKSKAPGLMKSEKMNGKKECRAGY